MPQPPLNGILETSLYVDNLDRAAAFYKAVFGFDTLMADHRMHALAVPGRQVLLLFRKGGSTTPSQTPFGPIPAHDAEGYQHLCFSIDHDDVGAWQTHLLETGIALESRLDWDKGGISLYFRDPDGHSIEVGTSRLWFNDTIGS